MKILFSPKPSWEGLIRRGFQNSEHEIHFAVLSADQFGQYDMVMPLTLADLEYLNDYRHLLASNPVPVPALEVIRLCDDKFRLNQTLANNGFNAFIPRMGPGLDYPYILKKRQDEWGANCHIIADAVQEQSCAALIAHPDYFCQALVPGHQEYTTHIVFKNHAIACAITLEFTFATNLPVKGKDRVLTCQPVQCPYMQLFANILDSIGFEGLCCFNFKIIEGRPFIFEINPRFGGSLGPFFHLFIDHLPG